MILKESDLCKQFVLQVKQRKVWNYYKKRFILMHVPNERVAIKNKALQMGYLRSQYAQGMLAGAPDYIIMYEGGKVAAIEFKRDKRSKLTIDQEHFKSNCSELELPYLCTYNVDEALSFMDGLLNS